MPAARHSPEGERTLVSIWRASDPSQSRFALEHGVAQSSLSKWVALYKPAPMALPTFATVEVVDGPPPPAPNLLVHLGSTGLRMEVPADFDAAELRLLGGALCWSPRAWRSTSRWIP